MSTINAYLQEGDTIRITVTDSAAANAAINAATEAEAARDAAQLAETGAEQAQTGAEAARDAAQTAQSNAETAETNASNSASAAATSATEAEAAKDEIVNDPTRLAALPLLVDEDNLHFYGDPANPGSGQSSLGIFNSEYDVSYAITNANNSFLGFRVDLDFQANNSLLGCRIAAAVDSNNYAEIIFTVRRIIVNQVLSGVSTQLLSQDMTFNLGGGLLNRIKVIFSASRRLLVQYDVGAAYQVIQLPSALSTNNYSLIAFKVNNSSGVNTAVIKNAVIQGEGITSMP